jgi:hypothetical protein
MSTVLAHVQSFLRVQEHKAPSPRIPRDDVRNDSVSKPRDEIVISLEAKKRQLLDQVVGRIIEEISAQAVPAVQDSDSISQEVEASL